MLTCPMCKKKLSRLEKRCPGCRTDLTLLVDYVDHLQDGLARAAALTRSGELGDAVWAYLDVLEVDPDNPTARRQVSRVATAIRTFDRASPGRRWLAGLRWRESGVRWVWYGAAGLLIGAALLLGYWWGSTTCVSAPAAEPHARGTQE